MLEYRVAYLSGELDFPETVERSIALDWASKSITQQLNEFAAQGWEIFDLRWLSDLEIMVTFQRSKSPDADP